MNLTAEADLMLLSDVVKLAPKWIPVVLYKDNISPIYGEKVVASIFSENGSLPTTRDNFLYAKCYMILFEVHGNTRLLNDDVIEISKEVDFLKKILGNSKSHAPITTNTSLMNGNDIFIYMYGPNLVKRASTLSVELDHIIRTVKLNRVLRIEEGRVIAFKPNMVRMMGFRQTQVLEAVLLFDKELSKYDIHTKTASIDTLVHRTASGVVPLYKPTAHLAIMGNYMVDLNDAFASRIKVIGNNNNYFNFTLLQELNDVNWYNTENENQPHIVNGYSHTYTEISTNRSELSTLRLQQSLFCFLNPSASFLGMYFPSWSFTDLARKLRWQFNTHYKFTSIVNSFSNLGTPIISGFCRSIYSGFPGTPNLEHMFFRGHIGSVNKHATNTVRPKDGHLLAMLGTFSPVQDVLVPPCMYSDSGHEQQKINMALRLFNEAINGTVICRSFKGHSWVNVKENLCALSYPNGFNIYISQLPDSIIYQMTSIGSQLLPGDYEEFINSYFCDIITTNLFFTFENKYISHLDKYSIDVLMKSCFLSDCPVSILGVSVTEPGLHFMMDLEQPFDFNDPKEKILLFSLNHGDPLDSVTDNVDYDEEMDDIDSGQHIIVSPNEVNYGRLTIRHCIDPLLRHPAVGSKECFTHHMNRCSNGLIAQQPGVGPLDIPVADYGFVVSSYLLNYETHQFVSDDYNVWDLLSEDDIYKFGTQHQPTVSGTAIALGEQPIKMSINLIDGAKLAMIESLTNLIFAPTSNNIDDVLISAAVSWSRNGNVNTIEQFLHNISEFAREIGVQFCVNSVTETQEDFLSDSFHKKGLTNTVFTATCPGTIVDGKKITPDFKEENNSIILILIDKNIDLSGSLTEHIFSDVNSTLSVPSINNIKSFYKCIKQCMNNDYIVSGHDISDGGIIVTLLEMAFSGNRGAVCYFSPNINIMSLLLSETPGVIIETLPENVYNIISLFSENNLLAIQIGTVRNYGPTAEISISQGPSLIMERTIGMLTSAWRHYTTSYYEFWKHSVGVENIYNNDYGENEMFLGTNELTESNMPHAIYTIPDPRCKVAVLCIPGTHNDIPIMTAFSNAGFQVSRVFIKEIVSLTYLDKFCGIVIAGETGNIRADISARAMVSGIKRSHKINRVLKRFFHRPDTFSLALGVLGIELMKAFKVFDINNETDTPNVSASIEVIENSSKMYESRWLNFKIPNDANSVLFSQMQNYVIPCWVQGTHLGIDIMSETANSFLQGSRMVACKYHGKSIDDSTDHILYPRNPSGSGTIAGLSSLDGRHTYLTFNPCLATELWQWQHVPSNYRNILKISPWTMMFTSAHIWSLMQSAMNT